MADGGGGNGQCPTACGGATPVCDPGTLTCAACTADHGCGGGVPYCDLATPGHRCVGCRTTVDCDGGRVCNPATVACEEPDSGSGGQDGGDTDGGGGGGDDSDGGATDGGGGDSDGGGGADAGPCIQHDGGHTPCTTECNPGFKCENGTCVLNGGTGPVQVTLRWDQPVDLDLHVDEPLPDGGSCEIYYGDSNNPVGNSACGALGSLDLDSNAGCSIDDVDIENVIYPAGTPPSGTYVVRVDYWANCSITGTVPYEVQARANGTTVGYCGSFQASDANAGGAGAGVQVLTFVVP